MLPFLHFKPNSKHYISVICIDQLILDFKLSPFVVVVLFHLGDSPASEF